MERIPRQFYTQELENRYGQNSIYSASVDKISERAAATLRCTAALFKRSEPTAPQVYLGAP